jgi:hypothetical protein
MECTKCLNSVRIGPPQPIPSTSCPLPIIEFGTIWHQNSMHYLPTRQEAAAAAREVRRAAQRTVFRLLKLRASTSWLSLHRNVSEASLTDCHGNTLLVHHRFIAATKCVKATAWIFLLVQEWSGQSRALWLPHSTASSNICEISPHLVEHLRQYIRQWHPHQLGIAGTFAGGDGVNFFFRDDENRILVGNRKDLKRPKVAVLRRHLLTRLRFLTCVKNLDCSRRYSTAGKKSSSRTERPPGRRRNGRCESPTLENYARCQVCQALDRAHCAARPMCACECAQRFQLVLGFHLAAFPGLPHAVYSSIIQSWARSR